jgi:hypothetical protein
MAKHIPATIAEIGDELNQCLQIIMTTAENMGEKTASVRPATKTIVATVDRAAKAVRALAPFVGKAKAA